MTAATHRRATSDDPRVRFRFRADGPAETAPAVGDGTVYLACANGCTHAFDADDGTERWSRWADGRPTAPTVSGETVYAGRDCGTADSGSVVALDAATGDNLWEFVTEGGVQASPTLADGEVFVAADGGRITALHGADGSRRRTFRNAARALCALAHDGSRLLLASLDGGAYARDPTDGRERWRFASSVAVGGAPAVTDDTAYIATVDDGQVSAISATTGRERWRGETGGAVWASPTVADGTVFVGSGDGFVYAFDAVDGSVRWRTDLGSRVWASPTVADDALLAATEAGDVWALDREEGTVLWWCRATDAVVAPVVVADATAYVADCGGTVTALSLSE
ncbi:outer membrane protein assembly factor BamB family protein [Halorussus salinus]|uniref:outer membrane protein assembly factor BamB family protein n=1 Tax=Halorussus salinus TaxID=1364935 RepID=UPI00138EECA1|nr:PQQ-binding-like beta-propeller repeat protein [Halorussus salinus]